MFEQNQNSFQLDIADDIPEAFITDVQKFKQSLINLLSNAAKFTQRGLIKMDASKDGDHLVFVVQDNGIGIPEDMLEHLFDAFAQVNDSSTGQAGTGLGLTITHRFISEMLHGELTVVSALGEGSTFTIRLPLVYPADGV